MTMAKVSPPVLLAAQLAQAAHDIADAVGEESAQVLVYGLVMQRWEPAPGEPVLTAPEALLDQVRRVLDKTDLEAIRRYYLAQGMDPSIYFYEEFTRACDPSAARRRGVHYSPPEVVSFMARAVGSVLCTEFGESLADAMVVDPCCGIGTFLRHIESRIPLTPPLKGGRIGVELSASACRLARMLLPGSEIVHGDWLGGFTPDAGGHTLVVIGNPPYSGHSANPGKIASLMADYRLGLTERNPKWLQDDYVKFIRMAQHHVVRAGKGIVAFITNHSYLFNPTFRAMRTSLMRDFDLIYVVDLQGNSRRNDEIDDPDENVFPIQMGVAISLMVRRQASSGSSVHYVHTRGGRAQKLAWLDSAQLRDLPWEDVTGVQPFHVFVPREQRLSDEYQRFPSILDLFDRRSVGFVTSRDAFAVDSDKDALLARIAALRNSDMSPDELRAAYPIGDLDVERARRILRADHNWHDRAIQVLYRPFDVRWAYYSPDIMERPRLPFMLDMMAENAAIVVGRAGQATGSETWDVAFCADKPVDLNLFRRGGATILPRYHYSSGVRHSSLKHGSLDADVLFGCVYAILWSDAYRTRYADFLRFDYPRVPMPTDEVVAGSLAGLGRRLMDLHLCRSGFHPRNPSPPEAASRRLTIGGYGIPDKYVSDRRTTGLSEAERQHVDRISRAAAETVAIQAEIDGIVRSTPPW